MVLFHGVSQSRTCVQVLEIQYRDRVLSHDDGTDLCCVLLVMPLWALCWHNNRCACSDDPQKREEPPTLSYWTSLSPTHPASFLYISLVAFTTSQVDRDRDRECL